jgi:hypothetical protein
MVSAIMPRVVYAYHRSFIGPLQIKDSDDFVVGGGGQGVNVIKLFSSSQTVERNKLERLLPSIFFWHPVLMTNARAYPNVVLNVSSPHL